MSQAEGGLSKEEIKHEIRSNHFMTNKVINQTAWARSKDGEFKGLWR